MSEFPEKIWERFSPDIRRMTEAVILAGNKAVDTRRTFTERDVIVKLEDSVGRIQASVTPADAASQELIFSRMSKTNPEARFLMEEKIQTAAGDQSKILTAQNYLEILKGLGYIVDPLDGTNEYKNNRDQWSIVIGKIQDGELVGGSIFAPKFGLLVSGEKNVGIMVQDEHPKERFADVVTGQDLYELPEFGQFMDNLQSDPSKKIRKTVSGALGFALVAAGKADVCIQPNQFPWDFAAGAALVEAKGGKVIFYHYRDGKIVRLNKLDGESFNPKTRRTAIIASLGNQAEEQFEKLQTRWQAA